MPRLLRGPTPVGPLVASGRPARGLLAALLAAAVTGCATAGPAGGPTEPAPGEPAPEEPAPDEAAAMDARALEALEGARAALEAGDARRAAVAADSLYFAVRAGTATEGDVAPRALWLQARALERSDDLGGAAARLDELLSAYPDADDADRAARALARLQVRRVDDPGAARTLLSRPGAVDDSARELLRAALGGMSVGELEGLLDGLPSADGPPGELRSTVWAALAAARARAGRGEAARDAGRRALEGEARPADRETARDVLEGRIGPSDGPVRVGLLFPTSGRLEAVGRWLRQGVDLALREHGPADREVELVPEDAAGSGLAERVRRLEDAGVSAILGPVRSDDLATAAGAREEAGLPLISPLAGRTASAPATLTLWDRERRKLDAAAGLGRWMGRDLRPGPVAALFPRDDLSRRAFLRFLRSLTGEGAWLVAAESYDSEATTLEAPVSAVAAFGPRAVFAGATGSSSVLQMAPQLSYYGIRGALVAGGADWGDPSTIRRLDPSYSQFRVVAAFADRREGTGAWTRFRSAFEQTYRASLGDNVVPALGHDAALLLARALEATRPARPRALARALVRIEGVEGATGRLRVLPDGRVARRVRLRAVRDRELTATSAEEARSWLASSGRLETARARSRRAQALRAVREADVPLTTRQGGSSEGGSGR